MAPKSRPKATPKLHQKWVQKLIQSCGALGPILGPVLGPKMMSFGGHIFQGFSECLQSPLLALSWPHFGSFLASLGLILGPTWPLLASSWPHFGLILSLLAFLGDLLASSWPCLGSLSCTWPHLGPLGLIFLAKTHEFMFFLCCGPRVHFLESCFLRDLPGSRSTFREGSVI